VQSKAVPARRDTPKGKPPARHCPGWQDAAKKRSLWSAVAESSVALAKEDGDTAFDGGPHVLECGARHLIGGHVCWMRARWRDPKRRDRALGWKRPSFPAGGRYTTTIRTPTRSCRGMAILAMSRRAVPALLWLGKPTGGTPVLLMGKMPMGLMGGTPMPRANIAANGLAAADAGPQRMNR
jgi:hypothetical protein